MVGRGIDMIACWISVLLFAIFCFIVVGIFYIMIKIQEKKFKTYMNEKTLEAINIINQSSKEMIAKALDNIDLEWRDKIGKS